MIKSIKKLLHNNFVKNVVILASGTAGAQAVTMALSPIITRVYGPETFGVLGTFQSITTVIIPIAALTYPVAIVLPKYNNEAKSLMKLSFIVSLFISFLSFLVIVIFHSWITDTFSLNQIDPFLYLIPVVIIFAGFMQIASQWLIRVNKFSINARVTFMQSIITNGGKVGIGFLYPISSVLVVIDTLGNGIKAALMFLFMRNSKSTNHEYSMNKGYTYNNKSIKNLAKEYIDFPFYRAPQEFFNGITNGLPTLMLAAFFGPASAGFYTIGKTVLKMPTNLVGKSVGDVFYPKITEAYNNGENTTKILNKATISLAGVGILPFGIVILWGPSLFSFVFGNDWVTAGDYARWIALWSFSSFINRPSVKALATFNAQRFHLGYTFIMLIIRMLALLVGYYLFKSDLVAIALFGVCGFILNFGLIYLTFKFSQKK